MAGNAMTKRDFRDISIFSTGRKNVDARNASRLVATPPLLPVLSSHFFLCFFSLSLSLSLSLCLTVSWSVHPPTRSVYARGFNATQIRMLITSLNARFPAKKSIHRERYSRINYASATRLNFSTRGSLTYEVRRSNRDS